MDPMVHLEHTSSQSACYYSENEVAELVGKLCVTQEDGRFISNSGEVIVNTYSKSLERVRGDEVCKM